MSLWDMQSLRDWPMPQMPLHLKTATCICGVPISDSHPNERQDWPKRGCIKWKGRFVEFESFEYPMQHQSNYDKLSASE
jgi:hypothetical protein